MPAARDPKNLDADEFVQLLAPDPQQRGSDHRVIKGWLGRSTQRGYWRLYPTPELDEYVEIAEEHIVLRRSVDTTISPLGGTYLVISSTAEIRSMGTTSVIARDALLHGNIIDELSGKSISDIQSFMINTGLNDTSYTEGFWCNVSLLFSCTTHIVDDDVCTLASGKLCGTARLLP